MRECHPTQHIEPLGFRVWRKLSDNMMPQPHSHSDIEVNFLFSNSQTRYLHGGAIYTLIPNRIGVLWGGIPHQTLFPGVTGEGIWLTLPLAWFLQWNFPNNLSHSLLAGKLIQGRQSNGDREMFERWVDDYEIGTEDRKHVLLLEIEARLYRLALEQLNPLPLKTRFSDADSGVMKIQHITQFIARHYCEPIEIQDIANAVGLNVKYLMRLFKKSCATSIWDYLTRLRISHAQRLLITTDLKIIDIALESGFSSPAPFYVAFKKTSQGLSPLEYRRLNSIERQPSNRKENFEEEK